MTILNSDRVNSVLCVADRGSKLQRIMRMLIFKCLFLIILSIFLSSAVVAAPSCGPIFVSFDGGAEKSPPTLRTLSESLLFDLSPLSRGNFEAHLLSGEAVFLKKVKGSSLEAEWLSFLNSHGLGIRFYGLVQKSISGHDMNFMVLESALGVNTQLAMMAPDGFRLTRDMVREIRRQASLLAELGIVPVDLQFQISTDGKSVKLIDPELFRKADSVESARRQTDAILRNLFLSWKLEDKIDLD